MQLFVLTRHSFVSNMKLATFMLRLLPGKSP